MLHHAAAQLALQDQQVSQNLGFSTLLENRHLQRGMGRVMPYVDNEKWVIFMDILFNYLSKSQNNQTKILFQLHFSFHTGTFWDCFYTSIRHAKQTIDEYNTIKPTTRIRKNTRQPKSAFTSDTVQTGNSTSKTYALPKATYKQNKSNQ